MKWLLSLIFLVILSTSCTSILVFKADPKTQALDGSSDMPLIGTNYYPYTVSLYRGITHPNPDYNNWTEERMKRDIKRALNAGIDFLLISIDAWETQDIARTASYRTFFNMLENSDLYACFMHEAYNAGHQDNVDVADWVYTNFVDNSAYLQLKGHMLLVIYDCLADENFDDPRLTIRHTVWDKEWHWFNPLDPTPLLSQNGEQTIIFPSYYVYEDPIFEEGWVFPRDNGTFYKNQWDQALQLNSEVILMATWNDFWEGTFIEPNNLDENLMLEITKYYIKSVHPSKWYKDVAVTNLESYKTVISQGLTTSVNVTVLNQGDISETVNITVYANTTLMHTQDVILPSGNTTTIGFMWNATLPLGNYSIKAEALINDDADVSDNIFTYDLITIAIEGDINADGLVNILDVSIAAVAFGTKPGDNRWDSNADVSEDRTINIIDISTIAREYGKEAPLLIENLGWEPTRIVNDKIYDGVVSFIARHHHSTISEASVRFIPNVYPHLPSEAFLGDAIREFVLQPLDGDFDENAEEFQVNITDIIGGREYDVEIVVRNKDGNNATASLTTSYIREFENLGKELYDNGLIVGACYMPWKFGDVPMKDDEPLLGEYDTSDDIVQWKHIDWATGHGVNVFWIDWTNWADPTLDSANPYGVEVIRGMLMKDGIKIGVMIGPQASMIKGGSNLPEWAIDLEHELNSRILVRLTEYVAENFCPYPNYLRIDGKPAVYIWDEGAFFNQHDCYLKMRQIFVNSTGNAPYIIGGCVLSMPTLPADAYFDHRRNEGLELIDAFTGWIGFHRPSLDNAEYVNNYLIYLPEHLKEWSAFSGRKGKQFVPTVVPGFDNSYSWGGPQIPLPRSLERFSQSLEMSFEYVSDGEYAEVRIDTWNDFGEWSYVEPSKAEGFDFLKTLKEVLTIWNANWSP